MALAGPPFLPPISPQGDGGGVLPVRGKVAQVDQWERANVPHY